MAALQAKRNPGASPKPATPVAAAPTPSMSKPDEDEVAAQGNSFYIEYISLFLTNNTLERLRNAEREAQEQLRASVAQREEYERQRRETDFEREREQERVERQRFEDQQREERIRREREEEERREQEERDLEERRRRVLEKEEADRQARYEAIKRQEEEEERKRNEEAQGSQQGHKPEEAVSVPDPSPTPVEAESPPVVTAPSTPTVNESNITTSTNNPFAKLQQSAPETSQAEKPTETNNKRVSYNPFASFSAFSATKAGSNDTDSDDDSWTADDDSDSEDESEFPAAGSAKNLAGKLFSVLSQRTGGKVYLKSICNIKLISISLSRRNTHVLT